MNQSHRTASRRGRAVAFALAAVLVAGVPDNAFAQAASTDSIQELAGVVQDSRGLPLLGAFVAVIPLGSDQPDGIAVTDVRGEFAFRNLREGMYTLLVGSLGFAGTVVQGINVPGAGLVSLQLEAQGERELAVIDAPLDVGWALRSGRRDILRSETTTLVSDTGDVDSQGAFWAPAGSADVFTPHLKGEFRLWSLASFSDHRTVGVTSIALDGAEGWNLTAHVGDRGAVWASSDLTRDLGSGHRLHVGFGYVGGNFDFLQRGDAEATDSWIGRLEVSDSWQVHRSLEVTVGGVYEHHTYLAASSLVSPRFEVAVTPFAGTRLFSGVSYDTEGLELANEESGFEVVSLLGQANLFLADSSDVRPERSMRYRFGVEQTIGDASLKMTAYYDDVTDELLGVYVAAPGGANNYLLFNVGDAGARGFELALAGQLLDTVSGEVTYVYRNREEQYGLPTTGLDGEIGEEIGDWGGSDTHELRAAVTAEVEPLHTNLYAVYNWKAGLPVIRDGELRDAFGRFDLRVRQPLPFRALDTEWSAMVQIRNVLGPQYDGLYNVSLAELLGLSRGIAGGLAVKF